MIGQPVIIDKIENNLKKENVYNAESVSFGDTIFSLIGYSIGAILLFHIFGVFGIFIALTYPLLWFFLPQRTPCFYCLHQILIKRDGYCHACQRDVATIYNMPLRAVFINMVTIFVLSTVFFALIVAEISFLQGTTLEWNKLASLPQTGGFEASEFILPAKKTYSLNTDFYFDVEIKNLGKPVNLVQSDLRFSADVFEVTKIDTEQSIATIFSNKDYSNREGVLRIIGGLPSPGFLGEKGRFVRIWFRPKKTGTGYIEFLKTSKIYANDGKGTNLLIDFPHQDLIIDPD